MHINEYIFTVPLPKKNYLNSQFTAVAVMSKSLKWKQGQVVWTKHFDAAPVLCPYGSCWEYTSS